MHPIFSEYLALLEASDRDERTLTNNRQAFQRVSKWLRAEGIEANNATQGDMQRFAQHLLRHGAVSGGPLKPSTVRRHLTHIRAAYSYAMEGGFVPLNPTAGLSKRLPREPEREPQILRPEEMRSISRSATLAGDKAFVLA